MAPSTVKVDRNVTVDALYDGLPEAERITAFVLRELIFEVLPEVSEKLSWGAPFYFGPRRSLCYVWPASVPWGKLERGVALGFTRADALVHEGYLAAVGKGKLGRRVFLHAEEVDVERVKSLLGQAWLLA